MIHKKMKALLRPFIPPILFSSIQKLRHGTSNAHTLPSHPIWTKCSAGVLAGREIFLDPHAGTFQRAMLTGEFDKTLFQWVDRYDWSGKVIYDIGAHVGYHTMQFAVRVTSSGHVFSFDPHPLHCQRIRQNLERNPDLNQRVTLSETALGNTTGEVPFIFSQEIENSTSSMSFVDGVHTPLPRSFYDKGHFTPITVAMQRLDDLVSAKKYPPPNLVKLDVEGAESIVMEGAIATIATYKPIFLIEVHGISNMLHLSNILAPHNYNISLLEDGDDRCFVAAQVR